MDARMLGSEVETVVSCIASATGLPGILYPEKDKPTHKIREKQTAFPSLGPLKKDWKTESWNFRKEMVARKILKIMSVVEKRDNFLISLFYVPEPGCKEVIKQKSLTFEIIKGNIFPYNA